MLGAGDARNDDNVVTDTFLINKLHATILFDTGADRSFVCHKFSRLLDTMLEPLENEYTIELADGKLIKARHVLKGCNLELAGHDFEIDLMPIDLGSFDVVIGMDWLSANRAEIVCSEKIVRIPLTNGES